MSFTSLPFLLFLAAALLLYYLMPKKAQWPVLLAVSYVFYLAGGLFMLGYILFTTLTAFLGGLWLSALGKPKEKRAKRRKKALLAAVLLLNFGLLFTVKYWDFTAGLLGLPALGLLAPLGLSFYMFQSMGYAVDCYRGKYPPQKNPFKFALFVSFFPQLIQGPISRYDALAPQLTAPHRCEPDNLKYGLQLALWGYMKKLIIADRAAVLVDTVFGQYRSYGGGLTALAVLFYCIQLYCDFSGGIDITRGVAQMFGIHLAENFRRPIFALSLTDYWRRWHITLGSWLRDYLFYPLSLSKPFGRLGKFTRKRIGGKLGKIIPTSLATFIIYFVIGVWHGANFRYIAYGFYNGLLITAGLLLAGPFFALKQKLRIREGSRGLKLFGMVRTWFIVFLGRYITRAPRLKAAGWMLKNTFLNPLGGSAFALGLSAGDFWVVGIGTAVLLGVEFFQERGVPIRKTLEKKKGIIQWLVLLFMLASLLLLGIFRAGYISSEFIYKQY